MNKKILVVMNWLCLLLIMGMLIYINPPRTPLLFLLLIPNGIITFLLFKDKIIKTPFTDKSSKESNTQ